VIESSFRPVSTFMNALMIVRFAPGRSLVLHNLDLIESEGPAVAKSRAAEDIDGLPDVIEERFGIPAAIVTARSTACP
jgi:arylamine N-acetyltransferase